MSDSMEGGEQLELAGIERAGQRIKERMQGKVKDMPLGANDALIYVDQLALRVEKLRESITRRIRA